MNRLKSFKSYLFTAYYNWLIDNEITPHLLVDANMPGVVVPKDYVQDGSILLSLSPSAIADYKCLARGISFKARFKGKSEDIYIPYIAMEQLIALETGAALPIGKALEQLELASDDEVYPDDGCVTEASIFSLEEQSENTSSQSKEDTEGRAQSVSSQSENPSFEIVKD
ncbi:MAG: ClpXP protease specificity-enhancing factor SspB [Succinivibrio sp.]